MIRPPCSDFWQVGLINAPITALLEPAGVGLPWQQRVTWLPDPGPWCYLADPFGLRRRGVTHVFVESFDYRTKHGVIEHHEFDPNLAWRNSSVVLSRPFHLSYPFIVQDRNEVFMIPECHHSGEITLYRAREFPSRWVRETTLLAGVPGAEASVIKHGGLWWMFFTIVGPKARDQRELHVAYAQSLTGPWRLHPQNPILDDRRGARPGGTPFVTRDGALLLPVQDCSRTYGGALRFLCFTTLTPDDLAFEHLAHPPLTGDLFSASHPDGCHTLSQCGDLTLVDTKRIVRSWSRYAIDLRRRAARLGFAPVTRPLAEA
ncbi:MAG: hypothetical protein PSU94_11275 [Lacunisphaera sp.]|nr:hypothetical protein [Lacunisphaera sp.]